MSQATSKRERRLAQQAKQLVDVAFENMAAGADRAFAIDLANLGDASQPVREAFDAAYSVLEWCRVIRRRGSAEFLLVELRCSLVTSIALGALGMYEVAHQQVRYALECLLAFLYFRDHPRELELAQLGDDQWELTKPSFVTKLLRRLPEYKSKTGASVLAEIDRQYSVLSMVAHPRVRTNMAQRRFLSEVGQDADKMNVLAHSIQQLASVTCELLLLADTAVHDSASEVGQVVMLRCLRRDQRKRVVAAVRARISGR